MSDDSELKQAVLDELKWEPSVNAALRRRKGDRPYVVPPGSKNLAFMGQFCELPEDVVFTVEYSIRSAQTAVYTLLGLRLAPPAVYKGMFDPRILFKAFVALHDLAS
jgi:oleate hydratase